MLICKEPIFSRYAAKQTRVIRHRLWLADWLQPLTLWPQQRPQSAWNYCQMFGKACHTICSCVRAAVSFAKQTHHSSQPNTSGPFLVRNGWATVHGVPCGSVRWSLAAQTAALRCTALTTAHCSHLQPTYSLRTPHQPPPLAPTRCARCIRIHAESNQSAVQILGCLVVHFST